MIITHNMLSDITQMNINTTGKNKAKSMERLSSGYKINRAADDAAGLAISEKMRSQIRGLNRAADNVQDGISYVKVADGALSQVDDILNRMRELSIQASNEAVYTSEDLNKINDEITQLKKEIGSVFSETEFNKKKIWDPNRTSEDMVQIGTKTEAAVTMKIGNSNSIITNTNRGAAPNSSYRLEASIEDGLSFSWTGYNGKTYKTENIPWKDGSPSNGMTISLNDYMDKTKYPELNDDPINFTFSFTPNANAQENEIVAGLNGQNFYSGISSYENIEFYDSNGNILSNGIGMSVDINYNAEIASDRDFEVSDTSFAVGSATNANSLVDDSDILGFTFEFDGIGTVKTKTTSISYYSNDSSDSAEGTWWDWYTYTQGNGSTYRVKNTKTYSVSGEASLENLKKAVTNTSGTNVLTDHTDQAGNPVTGSGYVNISLELVADNSFTSNTTNPSENRGTSVGSINISLPIYANDTVETFAQRIKDIKGADIYTSPSNSDGQSQSNSTTYTSSVSRQAYNISVPVWDSAGVIKEWIQSGPNDQHGFYLEYDYLSENALGISNINVLDFDNAQNAIRQVDNAKEIIGRQRSVFGAYQNRMEYRYNYDKNAEENMQQSESVLRDADMAEEAMEFAKNNVLEQAGISVLSQASQNPQNVLKLLDQ